MNSPSTGEGGRSRLFLIDAYALIYRSYFAFVNRPLTNSRGENTSAAFGFANFLYGVRDEHRPEYMAIVFDAGLSHRNELYPEYKATREKMPDELRESLPRIRQLVEAFGDRIVEVDGWEADDVIGTLATRAVEAGAEAVIVSGDKDFYQMVGDRVRLLNPGRGGPGGVAASWLDRDGVVEKLGVEPERVVDYLALVGDSADNVPGARGIGPKTAQALLGRFGSLDEALDRAEEVKGKRARESLIANRDKILLSRRLVTIRTDLEVEEDLDDLRVVEPDRKRLRALFAELDLRQLLERVGGPENGGARGSGVHARGEYGVVGSGEVAEIVESCREAGRVGVAVLGTLPQPWRGRVAGVALAPGGGSANYLPFAHADAVALELDGSGEEAHSNLPAITGPEAAPLRDLLADPAITKVGHDLKRTMIVCRRAGLELAGPLRDVMVASYVLDPGRRSHDLVALAAEALGVGATTSASVLGTGRKRRDFGDLAVSEALDHACERAELPLRLWERFGPELDEQGLRGLFESLETPLIEILGAMEMHGVLIDATLFAGMSRLLAEKLGERRESVCRLAGEDFNLNSTPQLREILFERLGLPVLRRTKTGPSTDSGVLEQLAVRGHELPRRILGYRKLEKLRNTYVDALPALVSPETGRIHTTFNQTVAATGRLSSSDPNLQNVPIEIRRAFVAPPGWVLLTADYSQIELRILAHLSGDSVFVNAFRGDKDIHRETAAVIFGVDDEDVTGEMRDRAKTVNFATLYGQGAFGLASRLGISQEEARHFIAEYFERFSGVRRFLDEQVALARERGWVATLLGRRRFVPELEARSWHARQFGERVAQNTPIQGTAADLIKVAMIRIAGAMGDSEWARMILQVHDELVFEVREERAEELAREVVPAMESAVELEVPLRVDVGVGRSWYECKSHARGDTTMQL